ncbi:hypothetical protein DFP72DRAFT_135743 [Ephemerocybe angulata]|uniref:Secreted protein n=1 Tax=Ephemerocybe angulata TaxID=980116 RepID=A0A8H6MB58_9AGAR|nr:hypothetical protein DFP72DRAFT_135743 [Tulosesus angulatus]
MRTFAALVVLAILRGASAAVPAIASTPPSIPLPSGSHGHCMLPFKSGAQYPVELITRPNLFSIFPTAYTDTSSLNLHRPHCSMSNLHRHHGLNALDSRDNNQSHQHPMRNMHMQDMPSRGLLVHLSSANVLYLHQGWMSMVQLCPKPGVYQHQQDSDHIPHYTNSRTLTQ